MTNSWIGCSLRVDYIANAEFVRSFGETSTRLGYVSAKLMVDFNASHAAEQD
jgi:hypothetical protein